MKFLPILLLVLVSAPLARAQTNALSLAEARQAAFERNWDLLAAKSGVDNATAQLIMVQEFPNPNLALSTAKIGARNAGTTEGNSLWARSYDTIAAVSQLIEIGGKRRDRQAAARAGVRGAKARFYDAKRTLDQGVTKAYITVLLDAENERVLTESAGLMEHEVKIAQARFAAGDLSESDRETLEINAEQMELQARTAAAATVQARIAVEVLMGVTAPQGDWKAADTLESLMTVSAPAPVGEAGATRPDVLAAETDLEGGEAQLKLQKAVRIPDPTLSIGVEHEPPDTGPAENTVNVGVSFPLPLWNRNGGGIKAAQAAVDQYREALGKARAQAMADVATAQSEYDEAHQRWLRYRDTIAPESARTRDTVAFDYEKGAASLVDLLNAEQTDNTIRLALAQAMNDTASAVADLAAARTVLTSEDLKKHTP